MIPVEEKLMTPLETFLSQKQVQEAQRILYPGPPLLNQEVWVSLTERKQDRIIDLAFKIVKADQATLNNVLLNDLLLIAKQ